ncbi:hypothetical protein [Duodenibacillus massiliensis]|uniref:hypothetical protein n=1 Tax=Duodenibacillus massiliensis TaxID=1852381 RepID=UPI00307902FE
MEDNMAVAVIVVLGFSEAAAFFVFRFAAGSRAVRPLLKVRAILPHPTMSEVSDISEKKSRNQTAETGSEKMYVSAFVQRAT